MSISSAIGVAPHTMAYVLLGLAVCAGSLTILIHTALYKRKAFSRISSGSPPPSQTRGGKVTVADYSNTFPPSQRHVLREIASSSAPTSLDLSVSSKPILRMDEDYRRADPSSYVFSGFSVGEIKALGDFPDYAKLSGVPLPPPLKSFDVDSTMPRPYRPFRWPYHQTMCMCWNPSVENMANRKSLSKIRAGVLA